VNTKYEARAKDTYERYLKYKFERMALSKQEYTRFAKGLNIYVNVFGHLGAKKNAKDIIDSILVVYPKRLSFLQTVNAVVNF
jgi:hypothetical protein